VIGYRVTTRSDVKKVIRKIRRENPRTLGHAGGYIRKVAYRSIRPRKDRTKHSPKGSPPYTHTKRLPKSILYFVDKRRDSVIIGPSHRLIGIAGAEHEHGADWRKPMPDKRPFMQPALEKTAPKLPRQWQGFLR